MNGQQKALLIDYDYRALTLALQSLRELMVLTHTELSGVTTQLDRDRLLQYKEELLQDYQETLTNLEIYISPITKRPKKRPKRCGIYSN